MRHAILAAVGRRSKRGHEDGDGLIPPYAYCLIKATAGDRALFRVDVDGEDGVLMPVQALQDMFGHDVPEDDFTVLASRNDKGTRALSLIHI